MPNPILMFLDLRKFGKPDGWRKGVKPGGAMEDIIPAAQYCLILLGDQDLFTDLEFQHDREEATLGVEHGSRPIDGERKATLTALCGRYECVHTFSHLDGEDIFEYMQAYFRQTDDAGRQNAVADIVAFINSCNGWNGLVQFLMNKQIGILGGEELCPDMLPHSALLFNNLHGEGRTIAQIVDDFRASHAPD